MDEYQLHLVRESLKTLDRYNESPSEFMAQLVQKSFYIEPNISIWTYFGVLTSHSEVFQREYVKNVLHNQPAPGRSFWPNYLKQINGFLSYMAHRPEEKEKVMEHAIYSYASSAGISAEQLASLKQHLKASSAEQKKNFIDNLLKGHEKEKQHVGLHPQNQEEEKKEDEKEEEEKGKKEEEKKEEKPKPKETPPQPITIEEREQQERLLGNEPAPAQVIVNREGQNVETLGQPITPQKSPLVSSEKPLAAGLEVFQTPEESNVDQRRSILTQRRRLTPEKRQQIADRIKDAQSYAQITFTETAPNVTSAVEGLANTARTEFFGPSPKRILVTPPPVSFPRPSSRGTRLSPTSVLRSANNLKSNYNNIRMGAQVASKVAQLAAQAATAAASNPVTLIIIGVIAGLILLTILLTGTDSFNLEKSTALCGLPDSTCGKTPPAQVELQNVLSILKSGPTQVNQGDNIGYNVTATYTGPGVADITVSDSVPAGTTYVSYSAGGQDVPSTATFDGNTVTWTLHNVPENTPQIFFFVVQAPNQDTWIQNTASAKVINTSLLFQGENTAANKDTCNGKYGYEPGWAQNGNFGDPNCDFSLDALHQWLVQLDSINADYWYNTLIRCESGYDPNAYLAASTSGLGAYGLFQMNPNPPHNPPDVGNVIWQIQVQNAVNEENLLYANGKAWHYWACASARW